VRLASIRERLTRSAQSGKPVQLNVAFSRIERYHIIRSEQEDNEKI
jgi:hypothetical protein